MFRFDTRINVRKLMVFTLSRVQRIFIFICFTRCFNPLFTRYVKKNIINFSTTLNKSCASSKCSAMSYCRRFVRTDLILLVSLKRRLLDRVWTRLSFVNHASYRAHLHLNANDAFSFSTLSRSSVFFSTTTISISPPFPQFLLSPSCPFILISWCIPFVTPRFFHRLAGFRLRFVSSRVLKKKKKNFAEKIIKFFN